MWFINQKIQMNKRMKTEEYLQAIWGQEMSRFNECISAPKSRSSNIKIHSNETWMADDDIHFFY